MMIDNTIYGEIGIEDPYWKICIDLLRKYKFKIKISYFEGEEADGEDGEDEPASQDVSAVGYLFELKTTIKMSAEFGYDDNDDRIVDRILCNLSTVGRKPTMHSVKMNLKTFYNILKQWFDPRPNDLRIHEQKKDTLKTIMGYLLMKDMDVEVKRKNSKDYLTSCALINGEPIFLELYSNNEGHISSGSLRVVGGKRIDFNKFPSLLLVIRYLIKYGVKLSDVSIDEISIPPSDDGVDVGVVEYISLDRMNKQMKLESIIKKIRYDETSISNDVERINRQRIKLKEKENERDTLLSELRRM